jgi:REP element-mobilizing transposase RayT
MAYDHSKLRRRSIRLKGYDYAQAGAYFVTICSHGHQCVFGRCLDEEMALSKFGEVVAACWHDMPRHFQGVELDAFVIMPNHVHGVVVIARDNEGARDNVGATHASPLPRPRGPKRQSVAAIVGSFKSASTRHINKLRGAPGAPVWQRNYYEHVIRNKDGLNRIRGYVLTNPLRWALDRENPERTGEDDFDRWLASFHTRPDSDKAAGRTVPVPFRPGPRPRLCRGLGAVRPYRGR